MDEREIIFREIDRRLADERRHTDQRFIDHDKLAETRFQAIERATELAAGTMNARLESMNEFRATIADQSRTYITRSEIYWAIGAGIAAVGVTAAVVGLIVS